MKCPNFYLFLFALLKLSKSKKGAKFLVNFVYNLKEFKKSLQMYFKKNNNIALRKMSFDLRREIV